MARGVGYDTSVQEVRRTFVPSRRSSVSVSGPIGYDLYYIPEFPLPLLRDKPPEDIKIEKFRAGRYLLLDDIRERGMLNPLVVWNHRNPPHPQWKLYPLPYYLKLGLNRRWCLGELGFTHAPCIVTYNRGEVPIFEHTKLENYSEIPRYWKDGVFRMIQQGPTGKGKTALDKYEFPEFKNSDRQIVVTRDFTAEEQAEIDRVSKLDRRLIHRRGYATESEIRPWESKS